MPNEQILDVQNGGAFADIGNPMITRATDPIILPQPYVTPADFASQFPTPLDTTEFVAMCEEIALLENLFEDFTNLQEHTWRELNSLAFNSGSSYIAFADGECPEEFTHDGTNTTVTLKNLGAKKSLSESDILHSQAVAAAGWHGINRLVGAVPFGQGLPGGSDMNTFQVESIAGVKEKEMQVATVLTMNGWDRKIVDGNSSTNSLEFDGFETQMTSGNGAYIDNANQSGTFSAAVYDRFLAAGCAKPTAIFGHPQAVQEMMSGYYQLGFQGSQLIEFETGSRIVPGFNFASQVNTSVGLVKVVSDKNFTLTASGAQQFQSDLFSFRERHNGVPLVYNLTQIPLGVKDLYPGCTAISFQIWVKTALIIKHKCAHGRFKTQFSGNIVTTCPVIG